MSNLPRKCVVDTNVPLTANLALSPDEIPQELTGCVWACLEAVEHVTREGCLVIDAGNEIYDEYRHKLSMRGQPGVGDRFMKWVHDHRWNLPDQDRVRITEKGDSYVQFPDHKDLQAFDISDRKFVAVANAHPEKPPILQATDSKWWGWKDALAEIGITTHLLCPVYLEATYRKKMGP